MKDNEKLIGVKRNIDDLGRVVIPKEMRKQLNFIENQLVSIKLFENYIQIEKSSEVCCFCGSKKDLVEYKDSSVCKTCLKDLFKKINK